MMKKPFFFSFLKVIKKWNFTYFFTDTNGLFSMDLFAELIKWTTIRLKVYCFQNTILLLAFLLFLVVVHVSFLNNCEILE